MQPPRQFFPDKTEFFSSLSGFARIMRENQVFLGSKTVFGGSIGGAPH
jgi:hypothetical protein